jgi:hypothetical protein
MLSWPQGHTATGRIMSMKKSSDTIDFEPAVWSAVPQPLRHRVPSYYKCTGQNCNIKLRESVQVMGIRGSEGDDYERFVRVRVPKVQSLDMWERK